MVPRSHLNLHLPELQEHHVMQGLQKPTRLLAFLSPITKLTFINGLFIMLLSGCTNYEEPEYNVLVNKKIHHIQLKLDANSMPYIMAGVEWIYTTKNRGSYNYGDTISKNTEAVLFTRNTGSWKRHSFRNISGDWYDQNRLLRNYKGELQPLIFDQKSVSLFALEGDTWQLKAKIPAGQFRHENGTSLGNSILLLGNQAWQTLVNDYERTFNSQENFKPKVKVIRSDLSHFILDSNFFFNGKLLFATKDANFALGVDANATQFERNLNPFNSDSSKSHDLLVYTWSHNPLEPKPHKQILKLKSLWDGLETFEKIHLVTLAGENKIFVETNGESMMEFALNGRDLVYTGNKVSTLNSDFDSEPVSETDPKPEPETKPVPDLGNKPAFGPKPFNPFPNSESFVENVTLDGEGCFHGLRTIWDEVSEQNTVSYNRKEVGVVHKSTCSDRVDTLIFPRFDPPALTSIQRSDLVVRKNGTVMLALTAEKQKLTDYNANPYPYNFHQAPSWLYLASLALNGKWVLEKISEN